MTHILRLIRRGGSEVREWLQKLVSHELFAIAVLGILVRIALIPYFAVQFDLVAYVRSVIFFSNGYSPYAVQETIYPPLIYFLHFPLFHAANWIGASSSIHYLSLLGGVATPVFLVLWKLPLLVFDILVALLIHRFVRELSGSSTKARLAFIVWMFNPYTLVMTYTHGGFDVIVGFFILLSAFLLYRGSYLVAGLSLGLGTLTKLFPLFLFVPLITVLLLMTLYRKLDRSNRLESRSPLFFVTGFALPLLLSAPLLWEYVFFSANIVSAQSRLGGLNQWFFTTDWTSGASAWVLSHPELSLILVLVYVPFSIALAFAVHRRIRSSGKTRNGSRILLTVLLFSGVALLFLPTIVQPQYFLWIFPLMLALAVMRKQFWLPIIAISIAAISNYLANFGPLTPAFPLAAYGPFLTPLQLMEQVNYYTGLPGVLLGLNLKIDMFWLSGALGFVGLLSLVGLSAKYLWRSS